MADATEPAPDVVLSTTLEQLRLRGAIFFRAEFTDEFACESAPLAFADALTPRADRMILFHIVVSGVCWVSVEDDVRHWASQGDVIVMPYGGRYVPRGPSQPATQDETRDQGRRVARLNPDPRRRVVGDESRDDRARGDRPVEAQERRRGNPAQGLPR